MATAEVPDFLTVEEAGRILRIGRTAAYQQVNRWLDTGSEGLPAERVGGSLRVPRNRFEQHYNVRITVIPPPAPRRGETAKADGAGVQDIPRSTAPARRRRSGGRTQDGLPFSA